MGMQLDEAVFIWLMTQNYKIVPLLLGQVFSLVVFNYDGRVAYELVSRNIVFAWNMENGNCYVGIH